MQAETSPSQHGKSMGGGGAHGEDHKALALPDGGHQDGMRSPGAGQRGQEKGPVQPG